MGNIVLNRYLRSTDWARNSLTLVEMERFEQMVEYFQRYAGEYGFAGSWWRPRDTRSRVSTRLFGVGLGQSA